MWASAPQSHGRPSLQGLLQQWNALLAKEQAWGSGPVPQSSAILAEGAKGAFEAPRQPDLASALGKLTPQGRQPVVEVSAPKNFASLGEKAGEQGGFLAGMGLGGGFSFMLGGGVQGLKQPLDLSVLEGGKGPAPLKGPPTIAVPLDFSILEKKVESKKADHWTTTKVLQY